MNNPERSIESFVAHAHAAGVLDATSQTLCFLRKNYDYNVLELGPGDSLFTAIIAKALGASHTWLVDAGVFATNEIAAYSKLVDYMQKKEFLIPYIEGIKTHQDILQTYCATYLTNGVASLTQIPSHSVDFCFSNAVLEHIPKYDFKKLADEMFRIMKPNGVSFHRVDLKDHLGGKLNNLRFSEVIWEGKLFKNSGFYTNRMRFGEIITLFEQAGFLCNMTRITRWSNLPTRREKLDAAFQVIQDDDLLINGFDIVLRRKSYS
ncbi:MAG: methyltransferase domain-containing protein [Steroidobacteraceae bacterium]